MENTVTAVAVSFMAFLALLAYSRPMLAELADILDRRGFTREGERRPGSQNYHSRVNKFRRTLARILRIIGMVESPSQPRRKNLIG